MYRRLVILSVLAVLGTLLGCASAPSSSASTAPGDATKRARACPRAPHYRVRHTRFGVSISTRSQSFAEAVAAQRRRYGRLDVLRVFDPGIPPRNAWERRTPALARHTAVVTSFRADPQKVLSGRYDGRLRHFFRTAPRHRAIFWSYNHEPEPEIAAGQYTARQYRRAFRHIVDIAHRLCRSNLYPTLILTGWTAEPGSHRDWRDYYPGRRYISVLGWDPYNSTDAAPTRYEAPRTLFRPEVRIAREAHKPWAIAETGSALVPGDDGSRRAHWLRRVGGYAVRHHAAFVTYWDSETDTNYRLRDAPSTRAWTEQVHR